MITNITLPISILLQLLRIHCLSSTRRYHHKLNCNDITLIDPERSILPVILCTMRRIQYPIR